MLYFIMGSAAGLVVGWLAARDWYANESAVDHEPFAVADWHPRLPVRVSVDGTPNVFENLRFINGEVGPVRVWFVPMADDCPDYTDCTQVGTEPRGRRTVE